LDDIELRIAINWTLDRSTEPWYRSGEMGPGIGLEEGPRAVPTGAEIVTSAAPVMRAIF